jgi:hypothetical protein
LVPIDSILSQVEVSGKAGAVQATEIGTNTELMSTAEMGIILDEVMSQ